MNLLGFGDTAANTLAVRNYYDFQYKGFHMAPHAHPTAELMYADGGEGEVYIYPTASNKEYQKIRLKKGQFIVLCAGVRHRLWIDRERQCTILNLEFSPAHSGTFDLQALLAGDSDLLAVLSGIRGYAVCNDSAGLKGTVRGLLRELAAHYDNSAEILINAQILELLILIGRCCQNEQSDAQFYVRKALDFMREGYAHSLTIPEIADGVGLNSVYLERLIKKHTGKTLLTHLNEFRLGQAKKLMQNTVFPLTDIAFYCGYGSRQSFYKSFKKAEGIFPSAYRSQMRQNQLQNYKQTPFVKSDSL